MVKPIQAADPIKTLAEYLTCWLVAENSMGLAVGGMSKGRADEFFKLRDAFGVRGYANEAEARKAICSALDGGSEHGT